MSVVPLVWGVHDVPFVECAISPVLVARYRFVALVPQTVRMVPVTPLVSGVQLAPPLVLRSSVPTVPPA